jgi:superfamily II DNA or RNA helicase
MINIEIKNTGKIKGIKSLPREVVESLRNEFTITNPMFSKKKALDLSIFGTPQYLNYYSSPDRDTLEVPVGGVSKAIEILLASGVGLTKDDIIDNRTTAYNPDFFDNVEFHATLRSYQQDMEDACMNNNSGVIQAKTGSGKTVVFVSYVVKKKQNTLILVNTKELAAQTVEAFVKFTNLEEDDIGFIGSGRYEPKPITVGILQSIVQLKGKELSEVQQYYGQLITDETHIIAAETYYNAAARLPFKHKFGFSATPQREDGLTQVIFWATGDIIHVVPDKALKDYLIKPTYKKIRTKYYFPLFDTSEFQAMITDIGNNGPRNELIKDTFLEIGDDRPSVFLCDRVEQVELLHELIPNSIMLTSAVKKKDRPKAMAKLRSKEKLHVISTFGLFSTGIDVPHLEVLYLCSPKKSFIKLKQAAGRLMRLADGKTESLIVDFVDEGVWLLANQWKTRHKILTNL